MKRRLFSLTLATSALVAALPAAAQTSWDLPSA